MEKRIIMAVEKATALSINEIINGGRKREIVVARQIAMYLIRLHCGHTLKSIGEMFNLHHASVIHSIRSVTDGLLVNDQVTCDTLRKVNEQMNATADAEKIGEDYKRKFFAGMYITNAISLFLIGYMTVKIIQDL